MIVVPIGSTLVEELSTPARVICFSVRMTQTSESAGASTTENHGMSPFQYSITDVLGVPPPIISIVLENGTLDHPSGMSSLPDSLKELGNRSAMCLGTPVTRPSAFARTGSNSINHDLNNVRAIPS